MAKSGCYASYFSSFILYDILQSATIVLKAALRGLVRPPSYQAISHDYALAHTFHVHDAQSQVYNDLLLPSRELDKDAPIFHEYEPLLRAEECVPFSFIDRNSGNLSQTVTLR